MPSSEPPASRPSPSQPEAIAADLVGLLHENAPADAFAARLASIEALPDGLRNKHGLIELARMAMSLRHRLEQHEERERGMLAVIESAQDLAGRLDLPELLRAIVVRARRLLRAHVCWLTIYDEQADEFKVVVADGAISEPIGRMTAQRNRGVAGVVMTTRMPFSTPHYLQDARFEHDPVLDDIFRAEGVSAMVGAPLIRDDQVIGLLFVADRYHRTHTALNISILSTLATHAAVAITNAKAFADTQSALDTANQARAELERHAHDVQGAIEAHERLTSLLARGATLSELCQSIAGLLQGSVLVLDETHHVTARADPDGHRSPAADAYAPHGPHNAAFTQALRESRRAGRSTIAYESHGEQCRVIAVIGGGGVLGSVLLFRQKALSDTSIRTFERSSSVIGIVLLSQERMEESRHRDVSALLQTLISPRQGEPALARHRAERHGLDISQPMVLILLDPGQPEAGFLARRARAALAMPGVVLDEVDGMLAAACGAARAPALRDALGEFARRELGGGHFGVLSRAVYSAAEMPLIYASLRRALPVAARLGMRGRIVEQNEMALYSVLFETQDRSGLDRFMASTIGPLAAQDARRGSELTATLLAYLDNKQNATLTAAAIGIHVNTVRQRLASIEGLIGKWQDPARALEIHMALRLWRIDA
ncbi:helix-turn-helix domain-containing protein [Bordetella pseudohinzii]|uniref:CdaR family transcriptional regulator n=1 Tax=Bordetella pseudohinzii TaxID=1331258 RepID=A0A0J6EZM9_9BORD|nr:GAF domain-containing protein [Bordetella pseudohinzii]ANY17535.1 CdaR family transcriptional regulator [Bordetella pseudohinzii]KMM25765.1 CdaR family transcriptional regulator [Bordetella pseudohinzii]KXA81752.1 CdaR family transcriptional regulator [Bordetella pseudohinzii]KXA83008.1 CdaR family transcriptional regulator [Bordetella pseudohinzii]CUI73408.1 fused phosphoenolpyruvate-protein phosphotransferase PtsP/GAF domain [Bordetella pseudohinzii]